MTVEMRSMPDLKEVRAALVDRAEGMGCESLRPANAIDMTNAERGVEYDVCRESATKPSHWCLPCLIQEFQDRT